MLAKQIQRRWLPIGVAGVGAVGALSFLILMSHGNEEDPPWYRLTDPATPAELSRVAFGEVEDQIRAGARGTNTAARSSWASQPGAIRSFASEDQSEIFKLYSATEMRLASDADLSGDVPPDWDARADHFVDLNAPTVGAGGGMAFPIADPRAFTGDSGGAEGFSYAAAINGVVPPDAKGGSHDGQRLPMPVRWRYVLKNGRTGTLDDQNRFVGETSPTENNPIVGRVAYWTDDLSCRINVNTAAEGAYWDVPRADTVEERGYAQHQPARNEYQRQPGHPATVCLSSVLNPGQRYYLPGTSGDLAALSLAEAEQLWRLAPGVGTGGSRGGTQRISENATPLAAEPADYHVYQSLDDVLESNPTLPPAVAQRVRQGGFLLATNSNAPETSLFGFPRIAMWPVPAAEAERSPFDQKIAELGTLGTRPYFVQRQRATSLHQELYTTADANNHRIYDFLDEVGTTDHPWLSLPSEPRSTRFSYKYGSGTFSNWRQICLAIPGYIRSANLSDPTAPAAFTAPAGEAGHGHVPPMCGCGGESVHADIWWQSFNPYPIAGARSFSISEVALVFIVSGYVDAETGTGYGDSDGLNLGERRFEIGLVLETFCPGHGFTLIRPATRLSAGTIDAGGTTPVPTDQLQLEIDAVEIDSSVIDSVADTLASPGGSGGLGMFTANASGEPLAWTRQTNPGKSFVIGADSMSLDAVGENGGFALIIQDSQAGGVAMARHVLQIRTDFGFLPISIPSPQTPSDPAAVGTWTERLQAAQLDPQSLIRDGDVVRSWIPRHGDYRILDSMRYPVVRRIASQTKHFIEHPDFSDSSKNFAHSLVAGDGRPLMGFRAGRALVEGANYAPAVQPDFPISPASPDYLITRDPSVTVDPSVTGDFDTGFARTPDGAYSNRPDDGVYFTGGTPYFDQLHDASNGNTAVWSPQRIMPGPGALGSLTSGGAESVSWRTLLFRPDPQHFGSTGLPDHAILDHLWMPVPEPHGISHDFSTDGKINMNYQILPFSHIRRTTALHALFKAEKLMAIPTAAAPVYKTQTSTETWRHFIDTDETLIQFDERFSTGGFFRSASEICEQYLVPEGQLLGEKIAGDYPEMRAFWQEHKLTGDNVKERPYTTLHNRLTTRSNTFKIYAILQPITKQPGSAPETFDPQSDTLHPSTPVSATLRRLLDGTPDCNDFTGERGFPDYLHEDGLRSLPNLDTRYRYSIVDVEPALAGAIEFGEVAHTPTGEFSIRWAARGADVFTVERSTNLHDWEIIAPNLGGEYPWTEFTDASPPAAEKVFYRVRRR